ncbi:MAG: class I SAM-dependent methyltransferase, partial [Acidobacteriaceae bacterium]|nr:class I SAM-dependent methyltransferase [Acidobacteriaceae bacterium]
MGELFWLKKPSTPLPFTGERFTSAESGQIEIEHVHRYVLARHFCRGKDVLDIASGEGYGSALLAQVARSVIGVDVADEAIAHAAHNYGCERLSFRLGAAEQLPLADASVDVVVSFETLEHFYAHGQFLAEIRRVLR